ncbi:hypothetical protein [Vibrio marisflavi]|uniref:hypothetical protein n=1 Tax=Vibrio marisflavi TaxID=1216040 RepID=UPI001F2742D2|nr:hypothetical protein [Vibrio marisflavi]
MSNIAKRSYRIFSVVIITALVTPLAMKGFYHTSMWMQKPVYGTFTHNLKVLDETLKPNQANKDSFVIRPTGYSRKQMGWDIDAMKLRRLTGTSYSFRELLLKRIKSSEVALKNFRDFQYMARNTPKSNVWLRDPVTQRVSAKQFYKIYQQLPYAAPIAVELGTNSIDANIAYLKHRPFRGIDVSEYFNGYDYDTLGGKEKMAVLKYYDVFDEYWIDYIYNKDEQDHDYYLRNWNSMFKYLEPWFIANRAK